ncbi:uncharacterized protein LOC101849611 [Aplysia californica]|uniref:Uncharacterized protein LOC101849611 n=1 Tax=Aplysia californica TaxID=6500 RepID=A0ABM0ZYR0_APLCA|nr:uncharacterized protein LOC101849611 [Aplysia californica]
MELPAIQENDQPLVNGHTTGQGKDEAPPEHLVTSREREYLARVCWLLHDVGTLALRTTFDSIHPPLSLPDHLQHVHVKTMLQKLHQQNILTDKQWRQLYPPKKKKKTRKVVCSRDFDTKVLVVLLQTVCHLTPPYPHGWHAEPLPADSSLSADVVRLQLKLQEIGALSGVRKEEYPVLWQQAAGVLQRLGGQEVHVKIQRIENEALPAEQSLHYIQLVKGAWAPGEAAVMMGKLRDLEEQRRRGSRGATSAYKRKEGGDDGIPPEDRVVITKCYKLFHDTVQAEDVLDRLQQGQVVKVTDRQEIMAPSKNVDRMQILLPKIMKSPISYAFKLLCDAIKFKYPRIYEQVMKTRKAVYKQGISDSIDYVGLSIEGLQAHYKEVFSKMRPLAWAEGEEVTIKDFFCQPEIVCSDGPKISLTDLLPPRSSASRGPRVVLEGFAGSGNTSLAAMMTYLWATQSDYFTNKYKFLLHLDAHAFKQSLDEEVYNQLLPPNFKMSQSEFWNLIENNARDVIVLLDGWEGGQGGPDISALVQGSILRSAAVLIFVRPEARVDSFVKPDYKLFNLGLSVSGISRCLGNFCHILDEPSDVSDDGSEAADVIAFPLESCQAISDLLKLPFCCTAVMAVYRVLGREKLETISSLTGLMEQYLVALAFAFCQNEGLEVQEQEFPEVVTRTISQLETLAFHSVSTKSLTFTDDDLVGVTSNPAVTQMGVLTKAGPGLRWKFTCTLLRDFLTARFLADLPQNELVRKLEDHHFLRSPRAASIVAFCLGLYRNDHSAQTLDFLFSQMASLNARRSKKVVFKPKAEPDFMDENHLRSGAAMSYCHSLMALTEVEGRSDAIEILANSFPRLLQLRGEGIINPRMVSGLCYMLKDPKVKVLNVEINLVNLHTRQKELYLSIAEALSQTSHLKTLTVAWSSLSLMSEFLKVCLSKRPALQILRVEDFTKKAIKTVEASTWADLQEFCSCLSSVTHFSFYGCHMSSVTCHVINSLPAELQILDLARSSINMIGADALGKFMENSVATRELRLTDTELEGTDLAALFQGLKRCETLTCLGLSGVSLGRTGFVHLIEYLRLASTVRDLDLSRGRLSMEMCSALADVLSEVRGLKRIDFTDTIVPAKGREVLEANATEAIYLDGLDIDEV